MYRSPHGKERKSRLALQDAARQRLEALSEIDPRTLVARRCRLVISSPSDAIGRLHVLVVELGADDVEQAIASFQVRPSAVHAEITRGTRLDQPDALTDSICKCAGTVPAAFAVGPWRVAELQSSEVRPALEVLGTRVGEPVASFASSFSPARRANIL